MDDLVPGMRESIGEIQNRAELLLSHVSTSSASMDPEVFRLWQQQQFLQQQQGQQSPPLQPEQLQHLQSLLQPQHAPLRQPGGAASSSNSSLESRNSMEGGGPGSYPYMVYQPGRGKAVPPVPAQAPPPPPHEEGMTLGLQGGMPSVRGLPGSLDEKQPHQQCWAFLLPPSGAGNNGGAGSSQGRMPAGGCGASDIGMGNMSAMSYACNQQTASPYMTASNNPFPLEVLGREPDGDLYSD